MQKLTAHLQGDRERELGALVVDKASLAWDQNRPQVTDFYDPHEQQVVQSVLGSISEVAYQSHGGYRKPERQLFVIAPQFYTVDQGESPVAVIEAKGDFRFASPLSHRDYLGSLLACGLRREKVGDMIVLDDGCQVVISAELVPYVMSNWTQVGRVPIHLQPIDEEQVAVEPERVKEIHTTVASMRLDAVASSGYGASRTRMVREIKGERVKVNWKLTANPSHPVSEGDVISIRGRGRVIVEAVLGKSRKGRNRVVLKRLM